MMKYYGKTGRQYTLSDEIGHGGEGTVYLLADSNKTVAKIYHDHYRYGEKNKELERKLETMIDMHINPIIDGRLRLGWPIDILYEYNGGRCVGYTMPFIHNTYPYYAICRTTIREQIWSQFTWKYSVQIGYNLAWLVNHLHKYGIIVGDMNPTNLRVTSDGTIILIDCVGFDITNKYTGEHFPCKVGLPEYLAPELLTLNTLSEGLFTKYTDSFSLAILLFRALMNNADPFGGKKTIRYSSVDICIDEKNDNSIINGECAYIKEIPGKQIPDWSLPFEFLPEDLQQGFKNTFDYTAATINETITNRTSPEEWMNLLYKYAAPEPNKFLCRCANNSKHVYPNKNEECPWCLMEQDKQTCSPEKITTNSVDTINPKGNLIKRIFHKQP